jgi:hypothetical protein
MSIYDGIDPEVKARGRLRPALSPLVFELHRGIWMTPSTYKCVFGKRTPEELNKVGMQIEVENFVGGGSVRVAMADGKNPPSKKPNAEWRQLEPGENEVWEIRVKFEPKIRILGRFMAPDIFVALLWAYRADLGDPPWAECAICIKKWKQIFRDQPPFSGRTAHDYFTKLAVAC